MTTRFSITERDVHIAAENGEEVPAYNEDDRPELNSQPDGRIVIEEPLPGVLGPPQPAFQPLVILFDDDDDEEEDEYDDEDYDDEYDDDNELDFETHGDGGNGWLDEI
jgi:hypothetical protein